MWAKKLSSRMFLGSCLVPEDVCDRNAALRTQSFLEVFLLRWQTGARLEESGFHSKVSSFPREETTGLVCFAGLLAIFSSLFIPPWRVSHHSTLSHAIFFFSMECKLYADSLGLALLSLASG